MIDLTNTMFRLARNRPVFYSEADFQHALAWQIHIEHPQTRIRLEYRSFPGEKMYTEIWCELDGYGTAIELKYPTRQLAVSVEGEHFVLADHSAQDITRYRFVKDIVRLTGKTIPL